MMKNWIILLLLCCASILVTLGCRRLPTQSGNPVVQKIKKKLGVDLKSRDAIRTANHPLYTVARSLTNFEDRLRRDGTITVKSPDVWTDSSLMHSIQEFDNIMEGSVTGFKETIQAYIAESLRTGLASETSGGFGDIDGSEVPVPEFKAEDVTKVTNINKASETLFSALAAVKPATTLPQLEPTQLERQRATFVNVNQSLRRRKLGGDNIRKPGYGLYLFRIPVSILPGKDTSEGYSAVASLRARMVVTASDVKYSLPRMAISDLVDVMAPSVYRHWEKQLGAITPITINRLKQARVLLRKQDFAPDQETADAASQIVQETPHFGQDITVMNNVQPAPNDGSAVVESVPPVESAPQIAAPLVTAVTPAPEKKVETIQPLEASGKFSPKDTKAIYEFIKNERERFGYTGLPQMHELREFMFSRFVQMSIHLQTYNAFDYTADTVEGPMNAIQLASQYLLRKKATDSIQSQWISRFNMDADHFSEDDLHVAWLVARHCGLTDLNIKRLIHDMVLRNVIDQQIETDASCINFMSEQDLDEATRIWKVVLEKEFPLQVFTLEPVLEEQNLLDAQSRLRQLQVALAASVANGGWNIRQRVQMAREIARDSAAIGLNRTSVGFIHGMDSFGWYFHPRVQSPDRRESPFPILNNAFNPESRKEDRSTYRLEPGIRDCEVLIAMPSFISQVKFDVTTNWESLAEPGVTKRSYEELIAEGCHLQKMKACLDEQCNPEECREGDIERMHSRVDQLEQMLGMQTHRVNVPFDYDHPASDLFTQGKQSLKPQLFGYHGLNLIVPPQKNVKDGEPNEKFSAEFFLTGRNFHPTLTHVVVGGHEAHSMGDKPGVEIISRELIQVNITIDTDKMSKDGKLEVRVGTPDGMTTPLEISAYEAKKAAPPKSLFDWTKTPSIALRLFNPLVPGTQPVWDNDTPTAKQKNASIGLGATNPISEDQFNGAPFRLQMSYEVTFEGDKKAQPAFKGARGELLSNPKDIPWSTIANHVLKDIAANYPGSETKKAKVKVTTWFIVDDWPLEKMDTSFEVTITPAKAPK